MKVLVACECSGVVRDAFLRAGHDAISCDLKPTQSPGPHYRGDVCDILPESWDLLIAHPVCRRLANSGVRWLHERPEYREHMREAAAFFRLFDRALHIPLRCIENPIMHGHALGLVGRRATQFVQPWMFGDPFQKMTGLWLSGLPPLWPEKRRTDYPPGAIRQEAWLMSPGAEREAKRSRTYPGIARAFAEQWGGPRAQRQFDLFSRVSA